jgi:hypothetical protein
LPAVFQNFLPVCWNCFIADNYRRQHPERLADRGWERGVGGEMFPRNPRRIFRRNQPAATKRALKVALGATPFELPKPHQSLVTR